MFPYIVKRLLWVVPSLVGISFLTFLLMEVAPGDAARKRLAKEGVEMSAEGAKRRAERLLQLEKELGLRDPSSGELYSFWQRYGRWLSHAARLDFAGSNTDRQRFHERLRAAFPLTLLMNALALCLALALAVPLAASAGLRRGGGLDRVVSTLSFVLWSLPEFLVATLLLLVFGGGFFGEILPTGWMHERSAHTEWGDRVLELLKHLVLPVATLAIGYGVITFRFLRSSVARAANSDFVTALRGWGMSDRLIRRRVLRNGLSPLVTLLGTMLPSLITGTVVVETIFSMPGLGKLSFDAVMQYDYAMVMALTMLVAVVTLLSLILSDILQRVVDPRVQLR